MYFNIVHHQLEFSLVVSLYPNAKFMKLSVIDFGKAFS